MDDSVQTCAIVIDESLPMGLAANTASVLALTIGNRAPAIIGPDIRDESGETHVGITTIPIPILRADRRAIFDIRCRANDNSGVLVVDFTDAAQTTRTYEDYTRALAKRSTDELEYLGLALYGAKKQIGRLTGSLPLLR